MGIPWIILECDEEHKIVFPSIPMVSFRWAKTLQNTLVRSKLPGNNKTGSCKECGKSNCHVCNFLLNLSEFSNSEGSKQFSIRKGDFNCNSSFVIYRLLCKSCGKQYVGSTKTTFRLRFNNYNLGRTVNVKTLLGLYIYIYSYSYMCNDFIFYLHKVWVKAISLCSYIYICLCKELYLILLCI